LPRAPTGWRPDARMARILHISDLHFGLHRPGLTGALAAQAPDWGVDVTVITGDLTQRARAVQFRAAAALAADLPGPVLMVPGNHDMPLWNPLARLFWPFAAWRRFIGDVLEPVVETPVLLVLGLNTADPHAWERGRLPGDAMARLLARLGRARAGQLRVVAMHHPLHLPPQSHKTPTPGAGAAALTLAEAGADVILCGHLHAWAAAPYRLRTEGRNMLCVTAGTTLSTRLRGGENDLNLIDWDGQTVTVTRLVAAGLSLDFVPREVSRYTQPDPARGWSLRPGEDLPQRPGNVLPLRRGAASLDAGPPSATQGDGRGRSGGL
jgi:predicted phosphodiesterase